MGNGPADDDEWWDNSKFRRGRVGAWNPQYLRKFTNLLQENTVLLQTAQKYPKNDPIHELRAKAVEHMQKELGMTDVDQLKQRLVTFRKFAANKLKQCAEKCGPQASTETILKSAPAWLRALEPHLSLWTQIRNARALAEKAHTEKAIADKPPQEPEPAPTSDLPEGEGRGTRLAFELVQNARELRSLDAEVVCKLECVPVDKAQETKYVWWRMLHVVTQKLSFQRDGSDAIPAAKLSPVESLLADLLLLLEPTISTLPDSNDYESVQHLVTLFHLAQLHKLEDSGPELAIRWRRAHYAYLTRTPQISGVCCGIIMMQRRWHELKSAARRAMVQYSRRQAAPCPLHAAIVKRFPHVVTEPLPTWQELVESGQVIVDDQQGGPSPGSSEADADELEAELEGVSLLSPEDLQIHKPYRRSAREEEDDLVLIEKEIETIDLINVDERDNELEQRAAQKKTVADALASELDRQLNDIRKHSGASETGLLCEEPVLICESDSDVECTEDRHRNIERIARQISEGALTVVKKEVDSDRSLDVNDEDDDDEYDDDYDDNDDCIEIDSKLLMDARITLLRVDSTPEWKRVDKRPWVDLTLLNLDRFAAKKPRLETPCPAGSIKKELPLIDLEVKVEVEEIKKEKPVDDISRPRGERQVKSMAKRLISEIMKEEGEETENQTTEKNKVTKKVKLPNIEEVRKNNMSMLTAQVAPLASGEGVPLAKEAASLPGEGTALPERRLSTDSYGELQIDETKFEQIPEDVTLSQRELQNVFEKLALERQAAKHSRPLAVSAHSAYCCTARRQRALNAARRRLAARSGKVFPSYLEIHSTSACATKKNCKCCCKHLLEQDERGARLEREALEVDVALRRLLGEDTNGTAGTSNATKKHPKKKKKSQDEHESDVDQTQSQQNDPLKEWIRQKSLNQKYFDLNLNRPEKPKTQSQDQLIKISPKPVNAEVFNMVRKSIYRNKLHALPSEKGGKNLYTVTQSPISSLVQTSPSPSIDPSPNTSKSDSSIDNASKTPNKLIQKQVSVPYNQKNFTLSTKVVAGDNSPKKLVKTTIPACPPKKVINFYKNSGELTSDVMVYPESTGVHTSIGKIVTNSEQKKTLILSPSEKRKFTLLPLKNYWNIDTSPNNAVSLQLSTSKGKIVIDSSTNETQEKTAPDTMLGKKIWHEMWQGKLQANSSSLKVAPASSSEKFRTPTPSYPKIVSVASLQGNQAATITSVKSPITSWQRKVAPTVKPGMATVTSMPEKTPMFNLAINQGKKVPADKAILLNSLFEKKTPPITKIKRKRKTSYTYTSITSPIKIAPKPEPENSEVAEQNDDADESQEPAEQITTLRGTGMKISKISSSSTRPANSRSLLRPEEKPGISANPITSVEPGSLIKPGISDKPEFLIKPGISDKFDSLIKPGTSVTLGLSGSSGQKQHRLVVLDKDGKTKEILLELNKGLEPTKMPEFKLESHFKRKDYILPVDNYLFNKDPTNLTVLVFDDNSDYLTVRSVDDQYLVLTEADLLFTAASYWSLVAPKFSARITFEKKISVKTVAELNSLNSVMAAPEKMILDKQVYVKLKDGPLIYAKALFVIRTPAECSTELIRNSKLHMLNMKGTMTSVQRSFELGKGQLALFSENVSAARALAEILNGLPRDVSTTAAANPPVKSNVNARADVVLMMNNVNRKAIELVDVESDDEQEDVKKDYNFMGLEKFEDIDEFDL